MQQMTLGDTAPGTLSELRELLGDCQRCGLAPTRTTLVFGSGDPHARVMFVGEAPGKTEDLTGKPFVGAAGKLLDDLLGHIGLGRDDVYIGNVLKCRPPQNRNPLPEEIATCTVFLDEQIRLIEPEVLVTLGNFATRHILQTTAGITRLHGKLHRVNGRTILPIYHPAAVLYDRSKRDALFADFEVLAEELAR